MTAATWSTACPDWAERLKSGRSIIPPPIFPDQADAALYRFKRLRVVDLPGQPTFGQVCEQWVFDFVRAIFGAYDAATGNQLIREFYLLISKKNTKSTIAAGIMVTALTLSWRRHEEHLILAPTKEVADNSFKPAAAMIRADEELSIVYAVRDHLRTIEHVDPSVGNSLKVVAADTETVSGKKAGRILVDEHWVFGKRANADAMIMEATGGQASRDEGWIIYLTTQSDEPPAGVFASKLAYYRDVRDGKINDPRSLGVLYEFPQDMIDSKAYLDRANFHITNPNLGRSVNADWLADQLEKAVREQDGAFQRFIAKHLNVQIGLNLRADRWAGADYWEQAGTGPITLQELLSRCEVVTIGLDGGGLDDLLGMAATGRERGTGHWLAWTHAWAHPSVLERRKADAPRFLDFQRQGHLTVVDQVGQDVEQVAQIAKQIFDSNLLDRIGCDQHGISAVYQAILEQGIPEDQIIGISQGWKLTGAIKTTERALAGGTLLHGAQPMMAWCAGNAKIVPSGNAVMITKQASGSAKIDPLMALFNAITLLSLNPQIAVVDYDEAIHNPVIF